MFGIKNQLPVKEEAVVFIQCGLDTPFATNANAQGYSTTVYFTLTTFY